jgi:hypothetical protein
VDNIRENYNVVFTAKRLKLKYSFQPLYYRPAAWSRNAQPAWARAAGPLKSELLAQWAKSAPSAPNMAAAAGGPADGLMADKLNTMARAFSDAKEGKIINLFFGHCNI